MPDKPSFIKITCAKSVATELAPFKEIETLAFLIAMASPIKQTVLPYF
jgi:hypothetical protein